MGGQGRLLLLLLIFAVSRIDSYSRYSNNPLLIYEMCARQEGVSEVEADNEMLKTLFEISQTPASSSVLNCVANKVESTNYRHVNEWFVGQTFDLSLAEQALAEANQLISTGQEFECLKQGLGSSLFSCLLDDVSSQSYYWYWNETIQDICSTNIGKCRNVQSMSLGCSSNEIQLGNVISKLFYGRCLDGWSTLVDAPPMNNSFTQCAEQVFQVESGDKFLAMAFPPSDFSQQESPYQFDYSAAMIHINAMDALCRDIPAFTSCIKGRVHALGYGYDYAIPYYNVEDLQATLTTYCANQDLILSQVLCTYDSVAQSHCGGGIMDALHYMQFGQGMYRYQMCKRINTAQHCRIQDLRKCNEEYSVVVAQLYIDLKARCKDVGPEEEELGQFLVCSREFGEQVGEKIEESGSSDTKGSIAVATDYICSERKQLVKCASDVYGTTDNLVDRLITTFVRPENMDALLDSICSVKEDLKENVLCIVSEVALKHSDCLENSAKGLQAALQNVMTWAYIHSYESAVTKIPNLCSAEQTFFDCVRPAVQTCSPNLGTWFDSWTSNLLLACGNPDVVPM